MAPLKRITILYFSSLLALIVVSKLFGGQIFSIVKPIGFYVLPLFIVAIGQIIGFIVALALEKPHLKQKVFNISYLIAFLGFTITVFYFKHSSWRHEKDFGNIEANQDHFKYFSGQYSAEEKIAFDSLSKLLVDPNSFRLRGNFVKGLDTVLNGQRDTIYFITLLYKRVNQNLTNKAKFAVLNNKAQLIYYNLPLDSVDNYSIDSSLKAASKNINDAMKALPDSIKSEIKQDFNDMPNK